MIRHAIASLLLGLLVGVACTVGTGTAPPPGEPAATGVFTASADVEAAPSVGAAGPSPAPELPSRIAIPELGIDLPVLSGDATVPGNPPDYPLCGVAQYLTTYRYLGRDGATTWIYAHAREGMFLPLLEQSRKRDGAALIGLMVEVDSTADRTHRYRITQVLRHALDRRVAADVPPGARRLVLQTSEGPTGTVPKLQVVAEFVDDTMAEGHQHGPVASPTACFTRSPA